MAGGEGGGKGAGIKYQTACFDDLSLYIYVMKNLEAKYINNLENHVMKKMYGTDTSFPYTLAEVQVYWKEIRNRKLKADLVKPQSTTCINNMSFTLREWMEHRILRREEKEKREKNWWILPMDEKKETKGKNWLWKLIDEKKKTGGKNLWWLPMDEKKDKRKGETLKSLYFRIRKFEGDRKGPSFFGWYMADLEVDPPLSSSVGGDTRWTRGTLSPALTKMPSCVPDSATAVALGPRIYVLGGLSPYEVRDSHGYQVSFAKTFYFDFTCPNQGWKEGRHMTTARACPSAIGVDGNIYIFGGTQFSNWESSLCAEVFYPHLDKWEPLPEPPTPLSPFVGPVHPFFLDDHNRKQLLMHALDNCSLYAYNLCTKSWDFFDENFGSVHHSAAAALDGVLYCYQEPHVCGYDLVDRKWFPHPVMGFERKMLPKRSHLETYLLHIGTGKLCLVWYAPVTGHEYNGKLLIRCMVFRVNKHHPSDSKEAVLVASIESAKFYFVEGDSCVDCLAL